MLLLLVLAHGVVVPARYGFLDDYALLYQARTNPSPMTDHILGGGRPVFALTYRLVFAQVDDIGGLSGVRALALILTCMVGVVLYQCLRAVGTPGWTSAATVGLLLVLPSTQVSVAWATMFIVPVSMLFALAASAALQRQILLSGRITVAGLLLPTLLLSLAITSYQPGAMSFWLVFAIVVLGQYPVRDDLKVLARLWLANIMVFGASLIVGFIVLRAGVAAQGVSGARSGTVTDVPAKAEWFLTEALLRTLDPWSLTPRLRVATAVVLLLLVGALLLEAQSAWRRGLAVLMTVALVPLSYVPNLLVAESWASTRTMVTLMPMVALLTSFALRAVLGCALAATGGATLRVPVEPLVLGVVAIAFAVHAKQTLEDYFVAPQERELAASERALAGVPLETGGLTVVRSDWFDSIAPSEHYDEFGIPSSCQTGAALGLTQLLIAERTGQFHPLLRMVERTDLPAGPPAAVVLDYADVLRSAVKAAPASAN